MPGARFGSAIALVQDLVWNRNTEQPPENEDHILVRIRQIMQSRRERNASSGPDLAVLLRQALIAYSTGESSERFIVPKDLIWRTPAEWQPWGLRVSDIGQGFLIEAIAWTPPWLGRDATKASDIFEDVFRRTPARQPTAVRSDPCISAITGFDSYLSPGQREAVRSLLFMPEGTTLVVNLPTGSGKTLVGQIAPLILGPNAGLTLFIVPTKALALDQERRMKQILKRAGREAEIQPFAWHSDLPPDTKAEIKRKIRSGTQAILFTSPESALGALLPALYAAAANGTLRYLVIDEAHIVAEWGDGFRPDFQRLAGLRAGLMKHSGNNALRTVLMSATISPDTLGTLETLFGPPEKTQMVAAVHLRPEPRYWSYRAAGRNEKIDRILELLRYAPRPFILYLTEPREALEWYRTLRAAGYARIACFHGDTIAEDRADIIDAWNANRLDGIIATSAFGVGMDKPDIPTIVHAVVPETLDRYYQEVGRGGRDGTASISVVVYTERDATKARLLGRPRLLSGENAFDRWRKMYANRQIEGDGLISIDTEQVPNHLRRQSDHNSAWNLRTLVMMARSGLLQLETISPPLPERGDVEDQSAYDARVEAIWQDYYSRIAVRTLESRHQDETFFLRSTSAERARSLAAADRTFSSLSSVLSGSREMAAELVSLYQNHTPGRTVIVSPACRGCPHGHSGDKPASYQVPDGGGIHHTIHFDTSHWSLRFPGQDGKAIVHFDRSAVDLSPKLARALRAIIGGFGIHEIVAPASAWSANVPWLHELHKWSPAGVLVSRDLEEELGRQCITALPRATVLWPWPDTPPPSEVLFLDRPIHVVFLPRDVKAHHPHRLFVDTADYKIPIERFLDLVTQ